MKEARTGAPPRRSASEGLTLFSPCPRGLEGVLAEELRGLGGEAVESTDGGVGFRGSLALCYRVNLHSRIASRVLMQVLTGRYRGYPYPAKDAVGTWMYPVESASLCSYHRRKAEGHFSRDSEYYRNNRGPYEWTQYGR